jgi:D-beta-D-heptose 7-phosphate kinase/D-beta-D-heptose 1-phosphate adenosyltransferase
MFDIFNAFHRYRVAVIGDLMLDLYLYGDVSRISPEAPVPVVRALSEKHVAGGAANVAVNLATLGVAVEVVGLTGRDEANEQLKACLRAAGAVDCRGMIASHARRTTRKMRIVGAHQQMVRIDHEDMAPCAVGEAELFAAAATRAIVAADLVVLSDYGKGVFSDAFLRHCLDTARAAGKKVIVDPKRNDFSAYRGATLITPNRKELSDATGLPCETDVQAARAAAMAQKISGAHILLTRSEKGMSYFPADGAPSHLATVAQDVFDVSGAGDTVVAVMAACLAAKLPIHDAMRIANHAAGIVVSKLGTATATRDEIAASLLAEQALPDDDDGALLDWKAAVALRWAWAKDKLTVGFANGCFDLLHAGHVSLIRQAAETCDRLIVAINSDASVKRLKGPARPVQDETARAAVIGALKGVSAVVIFSQETPLELIRLLQPDVLVKGADYSEDRVVGGEIVRARGGRVILAQLTQGQSTSRIIAKANFGAERASG